MIRRYSDKALLDGVQRGKVDTLEYMYKEFGPVARHYVKLNSGTQHDFEDVFQDAMIVLYKRSNEPDFRLTSSLKTYFTGICKYIWRQRLDRKWRLLFHDEMEVHEPHLNYLIEDSLKEEADAEKKRLMYKNIQSLPDDCQQILMMYVSKTPYTEIARFLEVKDEVYIKTRKYTCKNLLRKKIMNDPECQQFFNYE